MNYIKRIFRGRLNRENYILGLLLFGIGLGILSSIIIATIFVSKSPLILYTLQIIEGLLIISSVIHLFSLHVRRFHDTGHSGWMVLLNIIPLINFIALIYLIFVKGDEGTNKYGNPLPGNVKFLDALLNKNYLN